MKDNIEQGAHEILGERKRRVGLKIVSATLTSGGLNTTDRPSVRLSTMHIEKTDMDAADLEIVKYPHPALAWKSAPVTKINAGLREIVAKMFELMYDARGIGLAANQVGLPWRFFITNTTGERENKDGEMVFINPEIVSRSGSYEAEEGCLSLPEVFGDVRRAEKIVVQAFDLDGNDMEYEMTELPARAVLHETDHLDGVMFTERMSDIGRRELTAQLKDFEDHFRKQQESGAIPSDSDLKKTLDKLHREQGE